MANVNLQLAAAFESSAVAGELNQSLIDIDGGANPNDLDAGAILGDANAGTGETGITLSTVARMQPSPPVPGTRSKTDDFFVQEDIGSYVFQAPLAGNRGDASSGPPTPGLELQQDTGTDAVFLASGLEGTASAGSYVYTPADPTPLCSMVWDGGNPGGNKVGVRTGIQDALVGTLVIEFPSGAVPTWNANVLGPITPPDDASQPNPTTREYSFPVPDYGVQATIPPLIVAQVNGTWTSDVGAFTRCFQTLAVTIEQNVITSQDSCGVDGFARLPGKTRDITLAATMIVNDQDFDAEWDAMVRAMQATAAFGFQVGVASDFTGVPTMLGYSLNLRNIRVTSVEVQEIDETGKRGIAFEGEVTQTNPAGAPEFALAFI